MRRGETRRRRHNTHAHAHAHTTLRAHQLHNPMSLSGSAIVGKLSIGKLAPADKCARTSCWWRIAKTATPLIFRLPRSNPHTRAPLFLRASSPTSLGTAAVITRAQTSGAQEFVSGREGETSLLIAAKGAARGGLESGAPVAPLFSLPLLTRRLAQVRGAAAWSPQHKFMHLCAPATRPSPALAAGAGREGLFCLV